MNHHYVVVIYEAAHQQLCDLLTRNVCVTISSSKLSEGPAVNEIATLLIELLDPIQNRSERLQPVRYSLENHIYLSSKSVIQSVNTLAANFLNAGETSESLFGAAAWLSWKCAM